MYRSFAEQDRTDRDEEYTVLRSVGVPRAQSRGTGAGSVDDSIVESLVRLGAGARAAAR